GRQHFFGELEELDGKMAGDHRWIFDEVWHFLEQRRLRRDEPADAAAKPPRVRFQFAANLRFALAAIEDDEVLEQAVLVVVERLDLDRPAGASAGRQEAMAVRVGA